VCGSVIVVGMQVWISTSWVLNYSQAKGWRTYKGSEEAESSSDFGREEWAYAIYVVCFGGIVGDGVGD